MDRQARRPPSRMVPSQLAPGPNPESTRWYRLLMPFGISIPELLILLVVLLLVFGAKRLPEMGRSLGRGMREFKDSVTGVEEAVTAPEPPPPAALPSASSDPAATPHTEADAEEAKRETVG